MHIISIRSCLRGFKIQNSDCFFTCKMSLEIVNKKKIKRVHGRESGTHKDNSPGHWQKFFLWMKFILSLRRKWFWAQDVLKRQREKKYSIYHIIVKTHYKQMSRFKTKWPPTFELHNIVQNKAFPCVYCNGFIQHQVFFLLSKNWVRMWVWLQYFCDKIYIGIFIYICIYIIIISVFLPNRNNKKTGRRVHSMREFVQVRESSVITAVTPWLHRLLLWLPAAEGSQRWPGCPGRRWSPAGCWWGWGWCHPPSWWCCRRNPPTPQGPPPSCQSSRLFYSDEFWCAWPGGRFAWSAWSIPGRRTSSLLSVTKMQVNTSWVHSQQSFVWTHFDKKSMKVCLIQWNTEVEINV